MLASLYSVQGEDHDAKKRPRWFKIATWGLVLTLAFSILIYVVGFFYLLPAEVHGVGLDNRSLRRQRRSRMASRSLTRKVSSFSVLLPTTIISTRSAIQLTHAAAAN